jgi:hypothetical protein
MAKPVAQHFLLSARARTLTIASVLRMSDRDAETMFASIRWSETYGKAVCPHCGCRDLTTGVQFADLVAYVISWGWRRSRIDKPKRDELKHFAHQISGMWYRATRNRAGRNGFIVYSYAHITDLRTNLERLAEKSMEEGSE